CEEMEGAPGLGTYFLWASDDVPVVPHDGTEPITTMQGYFPAVDGVRFIEVTHPPGSGITVGVSLTDRSGGARAGMDVEAGGGVMHRTDTVDFGVILEGEINLVLED